MTHSLVWHDNRKNDVVKPAFVGVTQIHELCWCITHSRACHDSFAFVTWLIHMCDIIQHVWHDSAGSHVIIYMCDMTPSHVWQQFTCHTCEWVTWLPVESFHTCLNHVTHVHASFTCVTWFNEWHASFTCATWFNRENDILMLAFVGVTQIQELCWCMTHSCVWHDSCTCVIWLNRKNGEIKANICGGDANTGAQYMDDSFMCVTWLIHVCDMSHLHVWHDSTGRMERWSPHLWVWLGYRSCRCLCCKQSKVMNSKSYEWCSVVQCGAVCCSVLQCSAVWCSVV